MELLTFRQRQTLAYLALGFAPIEIASKMGVSKRTVDYHIRSVRERLRQDHAAADLGSAIRLMHVAGLWGAPLDELRRIAAGLVLEPLEPEGGEG